MRRPPVGTVETASASASFGLFGVANRVLGPDLRFDEELLVTTSASVSSSRGGELERKL